MGEAVSITRLDLTASELRKAASGEKDSAAARRILALALVLDGVDRKTAAETCGMDRQTLRDWVHRYNAAGLAGLRNLKSPGPGSKLTARQQAELAELVEAGPDPAAHRVVRWRPVRTVASQRAWSGRPPRPGPCRCISLLSAARWRQVATPLSSSTAPAIILLPRSRSPKTSPLCVCHPTLLSSIRSKTSGNICAATNSPSPSSTTTTTSLIKPATHGTSLNKIQIASRQSQLGHGQQSITRAVGISRAMSACGGHPRLLYECIAQKDMDG